MVRVTSDDRPKVRTGAEKDDTFTGGCIANVRNFVESIRLGKPIYNAAAAVESSPTGILGRMAAYNGRAVTRAEMLASTEPWEANLELRG